MKAIYKDNADTIVGNMDSQIFLGGSEPTTLKELNAALGKETIDCSTRLIRGATAPPTGQPIKRPDMISRPSMSFRCWMVCKCILQLRGVRPFLSDKYDLTQHPNYKYTSDYDKRNTFDIEKFLNRKMKLKKSDVFTVVDADAL